MSKFALTFALTTRVAICTFVFLSLGVASSVWAQSGSDSDFDFPYQAIVRNDDTKIFSGPASVHYATDKIAQGEIVQVYRHDPGGWCAIRPNKGSFSLIPEAAVEIIDDGVGEITQDNTQAWVGTRLGSVDKPLWQIKLSAGEKVEILGEASWPNPDGHSNVWYQIAPPAGEFRWVRFADLRTPPAQTRPVADARTSDLAPNMTDSGFKYDQPEPGFSEAEASEAKSVIQESNASGFEYVGVEPGKAAPHNRKSKPAAGNLSKLASSTNGRDESDESDPQWSNSVHEIPQKTSSPRVANRDRVTSQQRSADQPKRESQEGIDFKFRPIGQTAALNKHSKPKPQEDIIRDSAVAPAAFQGPVYDSNGGSNFTNGRYGNQGQSFEQLGSDGSSWRRGGSELAQRRSQYEAKYDQFNDQVQVDRREIEESFGVSIEDLPEHPRAGRVQQYGNAFGSVQNYGSVQSYGNVETYQGQPESGYPPADRFASLNTEFETFPHSRLPEKLTPRLAKIEEQLTNEMLKRPNEWQLADIELTVGQIYSQTSNPVERLQSQRILDKITKWKVIRNGYTKTFQASGETFGTSVRSLADASNARRSRFALGDGTAAASYGDPGLSPRGPTIGSGLNTDFEMDARFDASGWLTELVSEDRNNRPVYVLVNDSGKITHHVAGAPGLNLHRYLKSKVGISGRQGYNNRMKLDHITAETIDEIQR